ncbi:hypothetical protein [Anaerococcus urinomassiliensis]|uniref:hypothetical protein n=1 Tax=Anaerococcus urinomassiliensis TaxID=1745712 RepID=UPI00093D70E8|nr:hypothetical protein [Anaerococcus urinomassiliensis]
MSRKNKKQNNYKSFDDWLNSARKSINEFKEEIERELEEEENKKKSLESSDKKTVYRRFSDNADLNEIFPRPQNSKSAQSIMDKKSHEGKVNTRGSIEGSPIMGHEGDPVNPELRKRLEEKRRAERMKAREESKKNSSQSYKRKSVKKAEKKAQISDFKKSLKNKETFRKAILASEILGPPLSKRNNH